MTPTAPACPSDDLLLAYAQGLATSEEAALVVTHLETCDDCLAQLAEAGRGLVDGQVLPEPLAMTTRPGARVGRYELLEVIGRGAFGVVFLAHDPDLDRRVAVKLLRIGFSGERSPELARRAVLEAKAMARLSHPNVVTVHDVSTFDGGVYLAMELVEGMTLGAWLAARPRTWQSIVEVFARAGDGLAAAHAVGLVHRDFKPDNVLIADEVPGETRVLVTDFGLARATPDTSARLSADTKAPMTHTAAGAILGTPAYMAPEQLRGEPTDARADIFAFGVTLFEALAGERPFRGESLEEMQAAISRPASFEALVGHCPRRIGRVIARALAARPEQRWPTMTALVTELRRDSRRRWWGFATLMVVLGMGLGWLVSNGGHEAHTACVETASRSVGEVWDAERRERIGRALRGPLDDPVSRRVEQRLDAYVDDWTASRQRACDAVWVRGEQSEATLELRAHCLERRLDEFSALTTLLASGETDVAERAPAAVAGLPSLAECENLVGLAERERVPSEPLARALSQSAYELAASAIAAELAGRWPQGAEHARVAALFAEGSRDTRTLGEALTVQARLELLAGRPTEARRLFDRAIPSSFRAGDDRGAAKGLIDLAYLLAVVSKGDEEALRSLEVAEALLERLGGDPELELRLRTSRAEVYTRRLDNDRAIAELERAQALQAGMRGVDDPTLVRTWDALGVAQQQAERYGAALTSFDRGLRLALATLGPRHPETLNLLGNFGYCLMKVGRYREADAVLSALYPEMISTFGASHWNPAIVRQMWALAVTGLGRHEDALSWHADGIAILRGALADSPSQISYSLVALAESALSAGELGVAEKALREASELTVTHNPSNGSLLATIALHEAHLHEELGRFAEAEALFSRVRGELLQFIGDGVSLAAAQAGLGRAAWRRGDPSAEATLRAALARADVLYGGAGPASARTRLDLARVMGPSRRVEAEGLLYAAIDALEAESAEPVLRVELLWEAARLETDPEIAERLLDEAREIAATRATPRSLGFIAEGLMR